MITYKIQDCVVLLFSKTSFGEIEINPLTIKPLPRGVVGLDVQKKQWSHLNGGEPKTINFGEVCEDSPDTIGIYDLREIEQVRIMAKTFAKFNKPH
jgi:hypothetical protein